jgi:hypothetical protein
MRKAKRKFKAKKEQEKGFVDLIFSTIFSLVVIAIVSLVDYGYGTNYLVFEVFGDPFWKLPTSEALLSLWFIPIWATAISMVSLGISYLRRKLGKPGKPEDILSGGFVLSVLTGVVEEVLFRWVFFLSTLGGLWAANFLLCGIPEWLFLNILGPLANFTTLGMMSDLLFHPAGWAVGSAILGAASTFREQHAYQGFLGWVDSWFFAMVMFATLFSHGLFVCMIAHFSFNLTVFTVQAIVAHFRRDPWS